MQDGKLSSVARLVVAWNLHQFLVPRDLSVVGEVGDVVQAIARRDLLHSMIRHI